jgi:carbon-monoxide dehydrogenase small subunit/xanthine dehydrogenase small subunit
VRDTAQWIEVAFSVNGRPTRLRVRSDRRLLDVLRDDLRLTGAKEGCGKGECGTCTVLVDAQAVHSCLMMAYQADGAVVETIEGLAEGERLHPLQEAFVEEGAIQCGFCTPGMILAAKSMLDRRNGVPTTAEIRQALAGNLCRCTGYAKIVAAVARAARSTTPLTTVVRCDPATPTYFRPRSLEEALEILVQSSGEARPVAGGTDVLVQAQERRIGRAALFDLTNVAELKGIDETDKHVRIGAAATLHEIATSPLLARHSPALPVACAGIGGPQVRNRGTIGGSLAGGSPAADTVPPLVVADAVVDVVSISDRREIPITGFFTDVGKTVLAPDELIVSVRVPKRSGVRAAFLRLGQRQGAVPAKLSVAVAMTFREGRPDWVRVAAGGVGPTVLRALATEKALMGGGYDSLRQAMTAIKDEVRPVDDLRSTRAYRREMTAVLLERAVRRLAEA